MKRLLTPWLTPKRLQRVTIIAAVIAVLILLAVDVFGRVGGGHSYSGGSRGGGSSGGGGGGGGSGNGGALVWLIFEAIRLLVYLTIEYPLLKFQSTSLSSAELSIYRKTKRRIGRLLAHKLCNGLWQSERTEYGPARV